MFECLFLYLPVFVVNYFNHIKYDCTKAFDYRIIDQFLSVRRKGRTTSGLRQKGWQTIIKALFQLRLHPKTLTKPCIQYIVTNLKKGFSYKDIFGQGAVLFSQSL